MVHPADFYTGIVPTVYTALRGTHFGTDRYRAFVEQEGSPALELGTGDAGPFFDLAGEGVDIMGVDASIDMVRRGRECLASRGLRQQIFHQRMEDLDLGRRFAAIYLAGPTFNLLADDETVLRALKAIARHLLPTGAVLAPLWVPSPTPAEEFGVVQRADADAVEARYIVENEDYDLLTRTRTTSVRYELDGDGAASSSIATGSSTGMRTMTSNGSRSTRVSRSRSRPSTRTRLKPRFASGAEPGVRPHVLIVTASFAAIGYGHTGSGPFDETVWTNTDAPIRPYIKSKAIAEKAAWDFVEREGNGLELGRVDQWFRVAVGES